jgi:nitroreductase
MRENQLHQSDNNAKIVEMAIRRRRSVRHFNDKPIPQDILDRLISAGIAAPSGSNWQNQRYLVVTDSEEIMRIGRERFVWPYKGANIEKVKQSHPGGILGHSAALIIVFSDSRENDRRGNGEYHVWQNLEIQNCSAAIENILVLATALGLGTCWVSASDAMNYTRMLSGGSWRTLLSGYDIPDYYSLQGIIMLGYPKASDEDGYAKGETMHGATVWQSTARRPLHDYLIGKGHELSSATSKLTGADAAKLRLLSKSLRKLKKLTAVLDKAIHRIEFGKYLKDS